jgi:hypothetical protein
MNMNLKAVVSVMLLIYLISPNLCFINEEKYLELKSKVQFDTLEFEEVKKVFEGVDRVKYTQWNGHNHLVDIEKVEKEINKS